MLRSGRRQNYKVPQSQLWDIMGRLTTTKLHDVGGDPHPWLDTLFDGELPWTRALVEVKVTTQWVHERIQRRARLDWVKAMRKLWEAMHFPGTRGAPGGRLELMKSARVAVLIVISVDLETRLPLPHTQSHFAVFDLARARWWERAIETSAALYPLLGHYSQFAGTQT